MSPPYTAGGKLYLPEPGEDGLNIHVYDAKTGEKLNTLEHVMEAYPWKDTEAYRKTETMDGDASDVLIFGDESRRWQNDEGKVLTHWGVDTDTNEIYAMSYDEETDRLMEDLTQEERNDADGFRPYFALQNVTTDKTLAETRGDWLFADVSGPWIKVSRDGVREKLSYILVPGGNLVVRVRHAEDGEVLHLRGEAGYAVAMEIASRRLMQGEVNMYSIYVLTKHEDAHKN